jgi:ferredoxin
MMAVFESLERASETVAAIIADRIVPATLEFLDNFTIRAVEDFSKAGLPKDAAAMLLVELDGHAAQVEEDAERVEALCRSMGATSIRVARDAAERDRVWAARRAALSALAQLKPTLVLEDATVPRSRIPDMVAAIGRIAKRYDLTIGTFGHAGDGNLHPTILTDKRNHAEWERVEKAIDDIFDEALAMGGTLSGEHGTGLAKSPLPGKGDQRRNDSVFIAYQTRHGSQQHPQPRQDYRRERYSDMASMEALARLMRELEDQLVVCMRCGMCQSVCPVFDQTGREADVARGKLALLSGLMESMFDDPEGVYQRLNKCLLCGSCAANCPSGVSVQEIFLKARAILTGYMGLSPAKR